MKLKHNSIPQEHLHNDIHIDVEDIKNYMIWDLCIRQYLK